MLYVYTVCIMYVCCVCNVCCVQCVYNVCVPYMCTLCVCFVYNAGMCNVYIQCVCVVCSMCKHLCHKGDTRGHSRGKRVMEKEGIKEEWWAWRRKRKSR